MSFGIQNLARIIEELIAFELEEDDESESRLPLLSPAMSSKLAKKDYRSKFAITQLEIVCSNINVCF